MLKTLLEYKNISLFAVMFLFIQSAQLLIAQECSVKIQADSSAYEVGDIARITIRVETGKGISAEKPELKKYLTGGEIIGKENPVTENSDSKSIATYVYMISKYDSGDVVIPAFPVFYKSKGDTAKHQTLTQQITVKYSTLKVENESEIKDIKEPLKIPLDWKLIALYILIAVITIALAVYAVKRYMNRKKTDITDAAELNKSPYERAIERLEMLKARKLWQSGFVKQYYTEVTDIIRRFFEEEYGIQALEITTDEFINKIRNNGFPDDTVILLSDFLNNADLVKFAKFIPGEIMNIGMTEKARGILDIVKKNNGTTDNNQLPTISNITEEKNTGNNG